MNNIETHVDTLKTLIPEINDYMVLYSYEKEALEVAFSALQEKAERDNVRCDNCKHIRFNDNFHWCGCTAGLDGDRKLTDFCSYFEPKESGGKEDER